MKINNIQLINWRNYQQNNISFADDLNIIVAPNAQGKTNILEAIEYISTTKSFRTNHDFSLVKKNEPFAKITAEYETQLQPKQAEIRLIALATSKIKKEIYLDGLNIKALDSIGQFKSVLFSPEEIEKFFRFPSARRRWLDICLSLIDSKYAYCSILYKKIIINRNQLLKKIKHNHADFSQLLFWDNKWLEMAKYIIQKRRKLISFIQENINQYFSLLFPDCGQLSIVYQQTYHQEDLDSGLPSVLSANYQKELRYGSTITGPHREDIIFHLNENPIDEWGSRAQLRLSLLSLKLVESDYIFEQTEEQPVMLLDDIFSELDDRNQTNVREFITNRQVIITATDTPANIKANIIKI